METIGLVLLLLALPVLFFLVARVRSGKAGQLRPLPAAEELADTVGRATETGRPFHVSVGVAGVGGSATAETWAGLSLLAELADEAAACETPLVVTVADPTVLPLAQDILRRAYNRQGHPEGYDATQVRFVASEPLAYAAGVAGLLQREPLAGNIMVGSFGDEYLLMGETGARAEVRQLVGTTDPRTLSLVYATADEALIGEEIFAASAYTKKLPIQIASLLTQDAARWVVVAAIILLTVFKILF